VQKNSSIIFNACCIDDWGWEGMVVYGGERRYENENRGDKFF
jgi:hypothetical protein